MAFVISILIYFLFLFWNKTTIEGKNDLKYLLQVQRIVGERFETFFDK